MKNSMEAFCEREMGSGVVLLNDLLYVSRLGSSAKEAEIAASCWLQASGRYGMLPGRRLPAMGIAVENPIALARLVNGCLPDDADDTEAERSGRIVLR